MWAVCLLCVGVCVYIRIILYPIYINGCECVKVSHTFGQITFENTCLDRGDAFVLDLMSVCVNKRERVRSASINKCTRDIMCLFITTKQLGRHIIILPSFVCVLKQLLKARPKESRVD